MFGLVSEKRFSVLQEEMTLYKRTLEDVGWFNLSVEDGGQEAAFKEGVKKAILTSRIYYYRNPLAGHWCHLTTAFVFGEGVAAPKVMDKKASGVMQEEITRFWDDQDNKMSLTGFQAQQMLSNKIQYEGNLFFALFTDQEGNVRVRVMNATEIEDIIKDPDDTMRPLFYKVRKRTRRYDYISDNYTVSASSDFEYYPDVSLARPEDYGVPRAKLKEDVAIFHVKINCDINDKFGVPELYRALDWMKAHREMAGDLATLIRSLSTLGWKKKVKGGPARVNAIKALLQAKTDLSNIGPAAGSTQVENEGIETTPINTPQGGVKNAVDGLQQMTFMVCAGAGIFYHYFGDPSTGNLATAKSMELPMVKKFTNRQKLWSDIYTQIIQYQIDRKIEMGVLPGDAEYNESTKRMTYKTDYDRTLDHDFPPVIEEDLKSLAEALGMANDKNFITDDQAAQQFMLGMGVNNIDEELDKLRAQREQRKKDKPKQFTFPGMFGEPAPGGEENGGQPGEGEPAKPPKTPEPPEPSQGDAAKKAIKVKEAIEVNKKSQALRFARKTSWVMARMKDYARALGGHYRKFQREVREGIVVSGAGQAEFHADGSVKKRVSGDVPTLDGAISNLEVGMKNAARVYFPIAVDIGKKHLQKYLKESQIRETLFEAQGREAILLEEKLSWNDRYVMGSMLPAVREKVMAAARQPYETEAAFKAAINEAMTSMESRVGQYAGAFWSVEEAAVKEAGAGTGLMVNFAGADDGSTCQGCEDAMAGNPYPIDEAPEPGSHECDGNCRHALQILQPGEI